MFYNIFCYNTLAMDKQIDTQSEMGKKETASGNLSNDKVDTTIEPTTDGNYVYVSLCSCSINCSMS